MDDFEHIYRAYFRDVELYLLAGEGRGFRRTMAAGAGLILTIELLQPVFGRAFDINDVILNLAGVAVSAGVFELICRGRRPRRPGDAQHHEKGTSSVG